MRGIVELEEEKDNEIFQPVNSEANLNRVSMSNKNKIDKKNGLTETKIN